MFGARGNGAPLTRLRVPEALVMTLGQRHGRVKANNRKLAGDVEDGLNDRLPDLRQQKIQLRRVVPGHIGSVITVVDVAHLTGCGVDSLEYDRRVAMLPVSILNLQPDARIVGEVNPGELVYRKRRVGHLNKPMRMLHDPT